MNGLWTHVVASFVGILAGAKAVWILTKKDLGPLRSKIDDLTELLDSVQAELPAGKTKDKVAAIALVVDDLDKILNAL